jgi:hypothetical protein
MLNLQICYQTVNQYTINFSEICCEDDRLMELAHVAVGFEISGVEPAGSATRKLVI